MARPPLKECRDLATKQLIAKYRDEWLELVDKALAQKGWAQEVVEKRIWRKG